MTDNELLQQILAKVSKIDGLEESVKSMQEDVKTIQKDIKTIKNDVKKLKFGEKTFQPWVDKIDLRLKKVEDVVGL